MLVDMDALFQLFWRRGIGSWALQLVPVLGGSYVFPVTKDLSVMLEKTKADEHQWAI